jgi:hypothetical protein
VFDAVDPFSETNLAQYAALLRELVSSKGMRN